jgi:hypothetical protein
MDFSRYIGLKAEEVCHILDSLNIKYETREIWDTKKTKMGNDNRIVKIIESDTIILYSAYF